MSVNGSHFRNGGGRPKSRIAAIAVAVALIAVTVVSFANVARAAGVVGKTVVDPNTTNEWTKYTRPDGSPSTQNVGRIWTDKSVFNDTYTFSGSAGLDGQTIQKGDSDFLVGLSALSSSSNLTSTTYVTRPLDIVLVLDRSSSMNDDMTSGWFSDSRLEVLKEAVNGFIGETANANAEIEDEANQHRISVVTFSDRAQTTFDLTTVNDRTASQLKSSVNRINASGNTYPDAGFEAAQQQFDDNQRENAKKVVIFFTDGVPAGDGISDFEGGIAADAVNAAHALKQEGTTIYSIGVFQSADPDDTRDDFNAYMNAVSSKYPDATAEGENGHIEGGGWWGGGDYVGGSFEVSWNGQPQGDYYKTASDADELNAVFDEIFQELPQEDTSGSPIEETTSEGNTQPGTLTFTDQLGNYMQVTGTGAGNDKMQLAYGDHIYTSDSKTTNGNIDTYHFSGKVEGNAVYTEADLSDLVVTVERGSDPAMGDKVTVQLPASLLPMRHYDVDTDNHTMTVAEAYPVRLFYGVSLKAEAKEALNNPSSDVYAAIMGSQKSDDGKTIDFYTNSFTKGAADGSTTANFEPNAGNKFYYYTQDATLYIDQNCTTEANQWNSNGVNTLYWKDIYWVQTQGGGAEERTVDVAVNRGTAEWEAMKSTGGYPGTYYIPAGTPRSDRPATLTSRKSENLTDTAKNVLNPAWAGTSVNQHLGNNGKLSFDMPGSLEIKKTVDWGNASNQTKQDKNSFTFKVTLTDEDGAALTGSYPYYVDGATEQAGTVGSGGTVTISGGQSVKIEGLPAGTQFTVEEQGANQNGFTTTDSSTAGGNDDTSDGTVAGAIEAGGNVSTTFTNAYHAQDVTLGTETTLTVQKVLQDRAWRDTDSFDFMIGGFRGPQGVTIPMPENTTITIDAGDAGSNYTASFDDITFSQPGEYRYTIQENSDPDQPIAGIDYSDAIYRATVIVGDDGQGSLRIDSVKIERMYNDDGTLANTENEGEPVDEGDPMTFTNTYEADTDAEGIQGKKIYNDTTGDNPFEGGKFTFRLEAQGGFVTDGGNADDLTIVAGKTPMPDGAQNNAITTTNVGEDFTFPSITFDGNDVGNTYVYKVTEVAGTEAGMTYSKAEHTVMIMVEEVIDGNQEAHVVATVLGDYVDPDNLVFENTYDPEDVTLGENGMAPIQGTKTLDGRDMLDNETFSFRLTQTGGPAADSGFVTVLKQPETVTVSKDDMQNGSADFNFSNLTFSQVGTYTFAVNEVADDQGTETANDFGMTYDTNIATVTVVVSDNHDGTLKAEVTYKNDNHADTTDKALFANTYEASMNYGAEGEGGINVTKQMLDRPMANNEFSFTIEGTDSDTVDADAANAKLADADKSFQNTAAAENDIAYMAKLQNVSFDQDDAGKTFSYLVSETIPADGDKLAAVEYDQSQYRVDIEVVDNGNGTMHTVTTVTKTKASDGTAANEVVVDHANSDAGDYTAPTFGFVNDYNPTPATVGEDASHQIQVTKYVTGADSATDYTFTLTAIGDNIGSIVGLDQNNQLTVSTDGTIKNGESQTKTFGELTFTERGTYTFTVQEDQPDADAGWTFDDGNGDGATDAHTVTVYVTDRNEEGQYDGSLYIDRVTGSPVEIVNSYSADPVIVGGDGAQQQITVKKTVTGNSTNADFSFKIEAVDPDNDKWNNVKAVDEDFDTLTSITDDFNDGDSKTAAFGGIQFNATGEYQFKITEVEANDETPEATGWYYDAHAATVTVNVTDGGEGQLKASISYDNTGATTDADKGEQTAAAFTNSYVPNEVTTGDDAGTGIQLTKQVTGRDAIEAFEFSLSLAQGQDGSNVYEGAGEDKTAFDGMTLTTSNDIKVGAPETKTFDDITFTAEGDYKFVIDEITEKTDEGWTYDTDTHEVTVHVDDQDGQLVIAGIDGNNPTFENVYELQPAMFRAAYFQLEGNKVLEGRTWKTGDEFTFTLTPGVAEINGEEVAENDSRVLATMPTKTSDTINPLADGSVDDGGSWVNDNSAQFTFTDERWAGGSTVPEDQFTFEQPGTYRYLIRETNPNVDKPGSGILGVSYDQTVYRLTVKVTDNGDGTMSASGAYTRRNADGSWTDLNSSRDVTFTNKYSANEVDITFNAFKVLEGRDTNMGENEFKFRMEFAGWAANDANADPANDADWTVDDTTNAPTPAADTGNIMRGDVTFGEMAFTSDNVGYTYRYAITEVDGGQTKDGVTYDDATHYVTAKVTSVSEPDDPQDPDGAYTEHVRVETSGEAEYDVANDAAPTTGAIFTNIYKPGETTVDTGTSADAQLTKVLEGKAWNGDEFTFKMEAVSNTAGIEVANQPMPGNAEVTVNAATGKDDAGNDQATFSFGNITYDTPGTYVYKVTEVAGGNAGITYSKNEATVTVTVKDNNDGTLSAGVTVANNVFTNTYASELDFAAAGGLEIVKTFENADMREFSFTVTPQDEASASKLGIDMAGETFTTKPGDTVGDDNASHAEVLVIDGAAEAKFTQDDADDTYTYKVQEVKGADGSVDYDGTVYTVTITTADDGQGGIKVTTTVTDGAGYNQSYVYDNDAATADPTAVVPFTNTYKATGELGGNGSTSIKATKTLTNRPMVDGEFTFNVTNANDPNDTVIATGKNDANGTITFGAIDYSIDQMLDDVDNGLAQPSVVDGKDTFTYTYKVTEDTANLDEGVSAIDAAGFTITVTVTDNGDGTLGIAVTYPNGGDGLTFRNTYGEGQTGQAMLNVNGTKVLEVQSGDNAPSIDGKYTFTLTGSEGAPMPGTTTATNDAAGNVAFGDITYTMENVFGDTGTRDAATNAEDAEGVEGEPEVQSAQRTKTFTYTVTETGTVAGVTNDGSQTFTVTVTDNGDGSLSVAADPAQGALFTFTNTYSVETEESSPTGEGGIAITKNLAGRNLNEGEFAFELVDQNGTKVATGTNDANGNVELGAVKFTEPGTFTYTIREVDNGLGGVEYDAAQYKATAEVTDNGDGTLEVEWSFTTAAGDPIDAITFNNTYEAKATGVRLGGTKVLDGRALAEGEFSFVLNDADGNELQTVTNSAQGGFCFDQITYDAAGTYEYTISEVKGDAEGVTYDDATIAVEVVVTDNGKGELVVTKLTYDGKAELPVFTNTYVDPVEPPKDDSGLMQTGDSTSTFVGVIAGLGALSVAVGLAVRKRHGE